MDNKIKVGILGATGTVGQRYLALLKNHHLFEVAALGASPKSAGSTYESIVQWKLSNELYPSPEIASMTIVECCSREFVKRGCRLVFSGLDSSVAKTVEPACVEAGLFVFSNASAFRMDPKVPLVVPTVNSDHLNLVKHQQTQGFLVTNANCSTTGIVAPLAALINKFGPLSQVMIHTMQAVSGAGYPGVPSLDIFDNVIPFIDGEEDKLETEPLKILGTLVNGNIELVHNCKISASCSRVPVIDGHTINLSVKFANTDKTKISPESVAEALKSYRGCGAVKNSQLRPENPILVIEAKNRPQPRLDKDNGRGMVCTVGRIRPCPILDFKFTVLSHNTILGAAGSSVLNAEIAFQMGLLN